MVALDADLPIFRAISSTAFAVVHPLVDWTITFSRTENDLVSVAVAPRGSLTVTATVWLPPANPQVLIWIEGPVSGLCSRQLSGVGQRIVAGSAPWAVAVTVSQA
jgi:hypothetical protein